MSEPKDTNFSESPNASKLPTTRLTLLARAKDSNADAWVSLVSLYSPWFRIVSTVRDLRKGDRGHQAGSLSCSCEGSQHFDTTAQVILSEAGCAVSHATSYSLTTAGKNENPLAREERKRGKLFKRSRAGRRRFG